MAEQTSWRDILASALDWEQAHATLDSALKDLPPALRGRRPDGLEHSIWELLDHIRLAQRDLLEFCRSDHYEEPKWPDDYWPSSAEPTSEQWEDCIAHIHRDAKAFKEFTASGDVDLAAKIPHGTGQTYLRTILVSIDHTSYHVGQIIDARRLLGAWPPS